ncbi:hypothetical protein MPTK1_8g07030 [Marchantia polymorpha subsp. ruderalis]|uniref:Uncharacterized protein n=1 Tax=Marchantia polymorpha TaxID=3197 RepID=A0A2R6XID6_MARPO|nr:hypothetical protein MARPO_0013s0089 [Marchantia polymorpha]BBN18983.1 hypothetical protein Mp_8g07030 [Marchantia polymorpha subsp. ruderalis]|eukprot:PTQ45863.1 hypothetical protein MARPO_0013s0089 [Marchantia polymorpha]
MEGDTQPPLPASPRATTEGSLHGPPASRACEPSDRSVMHSTNLHSQREDRCIRRPQQAGSEVQSDPGKRCFQSSKVNASDSQICYGAGSKVAKRTILSVRAISKRVPTRERDKSPSMHQEKLPTEPSEPLVYNART